MRRVTDEPRKNDDRVDYGVHAVTNNNPTANTLNAEMQKD